MGETYMQTLKYLDSICKQYGLVMVGCDNEDEDFIRHEESGEIILYMSDLPLDEIVYRTEQWIRNTNRDVKINKIIQ